MEEREGCNPEKIVEQMEMPPEDAHLLGHSDKVKMQQLFPWSDSNSSSETDSLSVGLGGLDLRLHFGREQLGVFGSGTASGCGCVPGTEGLHGSLSDLRGEKCSGAS